MLTLLTSADSFSFIEEVIDVPTPLVMEPEDRPKGLHLSFPLVRLRFSWEQITENIIINQTLVV